MIIKTLNLSHFGKFHHKTVKLHDGINIVYGCNESGKSTIHSFIKGMLFGLKKPVGDESGEEIYRKYIPWEMKDSYSGIMDVVIEQKQFRIARDFYSKETNHTVLDLTNGKNTVVNGEEAIPFLGNMNRSIFENTVSMEQLRVETDGSLAKEVQRYYINLASTKNGHLNVENAKEYLKKERDQYALEAIEKQIEEINEKLVHIQECYRELSCVNHKLELCDKTNIPESIEEQIAFYEKQKKSLVRKSAQYHMLIEQQLEYSQEIEKVKLAKKQRKESFGGVIKGILLKQKADDQESSYKMLILNKQKALIAEMLEDAKVLGCYEKVDGKTDQDVITTLLQVVDEQMNQLLVKRSHLQKTKETKYFELKVQQEQLLAQVKDYELLQVQKTKLEQEVRKAKKHIVALEEAITRIEECTHNIYESFSGTINEKLSNLVNIITMGKYNKVCIDELLQIHVMEGKRKIALHELSTGTIHQIYYALRMVLAEVIYPNCKLPLILDETFVCYDDNRMKEVLKSLPKERQVIIFSCQYREKNMMDILKIPYHFITI